MSSILLGEGLGTSANVGTLTSMFTVGGIIAGVFYGFLYEKAANYIFSMAAVVYCPSLFLIALVHNLPLMYIGSMGAGIGWGCIMSYMFTGSVVSAPPSQMAAATGLLVAASGLGQFAAPYYSRIVSVCFGRNDDLRFPIIVCAVITAAMAILLTMCPIKLRKE